MSYTQDGTQGKIRVLIVDDSAFARFTVSKYLSQDTGLEVVGVAGDGFQAIKQVEALKPDVITLDVSMPRMDGLTALSHIMKEAPTPVIMLSALTAEGSDTTIKALELGAIDFILKPSLLYPTGDHDISQDLIGKIKSAARVNKVAMKRQLAAVQVIENISKSRQPAYAKLNKKEKSNKVVIIGSSTGGPRALYDIIPHIPADIDAGILIVQHMPPAFTKSLADRLDQLSRIHVKEAENNDEILVGRALLAPGGSHMVVQNPGQVVLDKGPMRHGLRPAVDITMESAVDVYKNRCVGVILTGVGTDGTLGAARIKNAGGRVIAQDKATCVVFGMPGSVWENNLAEKLVPLQDIIPEVLYLCSKLSGSPAEVE